MTDTTDAVESPSEAEQAYVPGVPHSHDGSEPHMHTNDDVPHTHGDPPGYVPGPEVQALVTTLTVVLAHTPDRTPHDMMGEVTRSLDALGLRGIVSGIATVELRGDGGLVGL